MTMLLLTFCFLCFAPDVLGQRGQPDPNRHDVDISFADSMIKCSLSDMATALYSDNDCYIFMYVNKKNVLSAKGKYLSYQYKKLLQATVRCDGVCENQYYKNHNLRSDDLVINKGIFIGLCCAGVAVFLLIVGLTIFGVCYRRRHYKRLGGDEPDDVDKEKPKQKEYKVEPSEKPAQDLYSLPDKTKKKAPKMELDMELEAEVKKKRVSSSSEDDNLLVADAPGNLYNTSYNPVKYNYAEVTSEI